MRLALLTAFAALVLAGCGAATSSSTPLTPAQQVAQKETGQELPPGDARVRSIARGLNRLAPKCTDSKDDLALFTMNSLDDLAKNGIHESAASLLKHVNTTIPAGLGRTACDQMYAAYLVVVEQGG